MIDVERTRFARRARLFSAGILGALAATPFTATAQPTAPPPRAHAPIVYVRAEQVDLAKPLPAAAPSTTGARQATSTTLKGPYDLRPTAIKASFSTASADRQPTAGGRVGVDTMQRSVTALPLAGRTVAEVAPYAGPPYQVDGKWYVPTHEPNYDEVGIASWYGPNFHGKASASGETFDTDALTAAHPTLPIPSMVRVTNLENGKSVMVRINDRGPYIDDRIIDLSRQAAMQLDMQRKGTAKVRVQYVGPALADQSARPSEGPVEQQKEIPPLRTTTAGFYVQIGSFAASENAQRASAKFADFAKTFVSPIAKDGSHRYRVLIGPLSSRQDAQDAQRRLKEQRATASLIVRLE